MDSDKTIPFANPGLRFNLFKGKLNEAFQRVADSNNYILSKEVEKFETNFATYITTKHCVGVNSATDGLVLSLMAVGIGANDEVITTGLTAPATITAILQVGAKPVVVDVLDKNLSIDPDEIKKVLTKKTKAIIPVHLHGFASDMSEIMFIAKQNDLFVIEDCSQAHGATFNQKKIGSIGHIGVFSFYPTKNLGTIGDGGAITTNDGMIAEKIKALRNYGIGNNDEVKEAGINSRLDEIQAAVLNVLLPHVDVYNHRRKKYVEQYHEALKNLPLQLPELNDSAVYHQFAIRVKSRNEFRVLLEKEGVLTGVHYEKSINQHSAFKHYCHALPVATKAAQELVSLPIQPEILDEHFETIVDKIKLVASQLN